MAEAEETGYELKNVWLAELLKANRDLLTLYWIEQIRTEGITGYDSITDEQLRQDLPPTVDSMIYALGTGDTEGPRRHSFGVIQRRMEGGFQLLDLQMSLHALQTAVMRMVGEANLGHEKELEALQTASAAYYQVALIAAAVYDHLRVEQQERFATTYEFGLTLSQNLELGVILDIAVANVAGYMKAGSVAIMLAEEEHGRNVIRAWHNLNEQTVKALPDACAALGCPTARDSTCSAHDVRTSHQPGEWSELLASGGLVSIVCTPLVAKQRRLGSLVVLWSDVHKATDAEMNFLLAMAGHIANAVQNAILYQEAQGKRELGVLLQASRLFTSSLDTHDIIRKLARMASSALRADIAMVFISARPGAPVSQIAQYAGAGKPRQAVRRIMEAIAQEDEENWFAGLGPNFARGEAVLFSSSEEFPGRLQRLVGIVGSVLAAPLQQKGAVFGALAVVSLNEGVFRRNDLPLATGLADLASIAIQNARSYEHERNISETLQRGFLPPNLPTVPGYEAAAYYRPALAEAGIGGDFYDLFSSGDGKISVTIGDVSGKGLQAAVPTAMGKYSVRAYAAEDASPSSVLVRVNRIFYENSPEIQFMTALYGSLNPTTNVFTYSNAGHNPPLLYSAASGEIAEMQVGGTCLGVALDVAYEDREIELQPRDVLLLFTDGATDVKVDGGRLDIEGLRQLLYSAVHLPGEQIVRKVFDGIYARGRGRLPDDVALVVIKRVATLA